MILDVLAAVFGLIWVGAAIASVCFLYGALANGAPVYYLLGSIGVAVLAWILFAKINKNIEQFKYVDQLVVRGYTLAEARSAWEITINGGSNLLLNLQQADTISEGGRDAN